MSRQSVPAKSLAAKHASARGYTSVEVLIAMTLFAIGAAGVIGMQRVTIQGGEDARRFDMATNIANEWISRLQKDASFWRTQPDPLLPDDMGFLKTTWLQNIDGCANQFCSQAPAEPTTEQLSFDVFGRDVPAGQAYYCVQYRLTWLAKPGAPPYNRPLNPTALMRAEVRVFWNRLERDPIGNCAAPVLGVPPGIIPLNPPYHMVYAATSLREGPPR